MINNISPTSGSATTDQFQFRHLHPKIFMGTASDRYAGWLDQIYTRKQYEDQISKRSKKVGGKSFQEATLPVESVKEYFQHFSVLEIDYTFYSLLLDKDRQPAKNFHVLKSYAQYIPEGDRVVLKVPQAISAQKVRHGKSFIANETYLDPEIFIKQFYEPAVSLLGGRLPRLIGMSHVMDLILTGRPVEADEAKNMGLANRIVPHGKSREAAEELATQIARFPQMCMRSDRMSAYEQWDKDFQDAMANEFHRGMEPILKGETLRGASMFSKGVGKHGEF